MLFILQDYQIEYSHTPILLTDRTSHPLREAWVTQSLKNINSKKSCKTFKIC